MRQTANLTAVNEAATADLSGGGDGDLLVQVSGTFVATLQFEASVNGSSWVSIAAEPAAGGASVTSTTAAGVWRVKAGGLQVRVRASAYTSGPAVVDFERAVRG